MPPHLLIEFKTQRYQNEPGFNGVYSRSILPKIKDGEYVIVLDKYKSIWSHCIVLYMNGDVIYFDSLGIEYISKEIKTFIGSRNVTTNIFRVLAYNSIMCEYFCTGFIDIMLKG